MTNTLLHLLPKRWVLVLTVCFAATRLPAAVIWNENVNGDLSDNQAAPNPFVLAVGTNSIIGFVGNPNTQDWIALTIPAGFQLSSVVLAAYNSSDLQGFTGVQIGPTFIGSPFIASSYLGYAHFGTGAQNGPLPPANLVGTDILPIMGNLVTAPGSTGFTPPLGANVYTFLIQQTGNVANYQFDYVVTAVPEPASIVLLALGGALVLLKRRVST
jgi:hypothetical protein